LETDAERIARQNAERAEELRRVPLQTIDKSKWPKDVRPIGMSEADGLGIDTDGRLYWNGKPVEIIGRRIDLTWTQTVVANRRGYLHCAWSSRNDDAERDLLP
jgi:hypothetical protein